MRTDILQKIRKMPDREIYTFFREDHFYDDPELTMAVCQELENREAARTGRRPVTITFEELPPGVYGAAGGTGDQKAIVLNIAFLKKAVPQILTPGAAMNTIFHEGRHIWQRCVIETDDRRVPISIRLLLLADCICYINGTENVIDVGLSPDLQGILEYALQENEIDARFYALRRMAEVQASVGMDDAFLIDMESERQGELAYIKATLNCFDEDKYQLLEKKRLEVYKTRAEEYYRSTGNRLPELPKNFRCYQNIWMIQHVIRPVLFFFLQEVEELRNDAMKVDDLLFGLFTIARNCAAEGRPLETPDELLKIVIHGELCKEFHLKQDVIPKEWDKPIKL